jgi:PHP family Zn ribbon phosphoesterase
VNIDTQMERLRERVSKLSEEYNHGSCLNCEAQLTQADIDNDCTCTNCGSSIDGDDEDLLEVEQGDYTWDGYSHGDD